MALTQIKGMKVAFGRALSASDLNSVNATTTESAAITLFEGFTPYVDIPQIEMIGDFGLTQNIQSYDNINTGLTQKIVTTRTSADFDLEMQYDADLSVFADMKAAVDAGFNHAFRFTLNDKDPGVAQEPTIVYVSGIMAGWTFGGGDVNGIIKVKTTVAANTLLYVKEKN